VKKIAALIIFTAIVYANSLANNFVLDDSSVILGNKFIKLWKNFPRIFTRSYLTPFTDTAVDHRFGSQETSYRPVTTASYFIDHALWKNNPFGYHLTNLLLHIFNVILVYTLALLITGTSAAALFAGLLFALHPANAEAVNVISFRDDLLCFTFFISSLIFYIKLRKPAAKKNPLIYAASLCLFLLALFSKEMAISLPLVILLYDWIFNRESEAGKPLIRPRHFGYFFVLLFYAWIRFSVMRNPTEPAVAYIGGSFFTAMIAMFQAAAAYLKTLVLPLDAHYILPQDPRISVNPVFVPAALFSALLVLSVLLFALKARRNFKVAAFCIFWFFVTLLPVSNLWPITNPMAMRYLYIPISGFCILLALALTRRNTFKAGVLAVVILSFYAFFTTAANRTWHNNAGFWAEMTKKYPESPLAYYNLGLAYAKARQADTAIPLFKKAISLKPAYADAHRNLGICYLLNGISDKAIEEFNASLNSKPRSADTYNDLGIGYAAKKDYEKAQKMWREALAIDPEHKNAQSNLEQSAGKI